ncbi:MAG: gas vesicle protein K [Methanotrichaceae archaeon]|jgi:Ser/Thr protein kinase RdoA (MazF antagonist)
MTINIDEENLKEGLLGLVVALVEIIEEVLERQAIRRMEGGRLSDEEMERLGDALAELDEALEKIKVDNGIEDAVKSVRDGLDNVAENIVDQFIDPERWTEKQGSLDCER